MTGRAPEPAEPATPAGRERADFACPNCRDTGYACEDHPELPWEGVHGSTALHPEHGGAGMPCPTCCDPIPQDGTRSITDAFTPRHLRG